MSPDGPSLWATDLFDRESPPSLEERCPSLEAGLASLWRHVLLEGVQADGQPTFTDFSLRVPGRPSVSLPRDPASNPELARLRWRLGNEEPAFLRRLAACHLAHLDQPFSFAPFLALTVELPAGVVRVVEVLAGALEVAGPLEATPAGWRRGPAGGRHLLARRCDGRGPAQSFILEAWSIETGGAVPLRVVLEGPHPLRSDPARVEGAESPAAKTLVDALLEAGVDLQAP